MASSALHLGASCGARAVCVLVHGRGQSPEEMQSHILSRLDVADIAFCLPRAEEGSWYAARAVDSLTESTKAALQVALDHLEREVTRARTSYPGLPLVLAGFSQGACLSLEYVFSGRPAPEALVAFTGCRVGQPADGLPQALPANLPVYLTGSDADPWIPVTAFAEAVLDLGRGQARARSDLFPGRGHEVSDAEVTMLQSVLADLASGKTPGMAAPR
ncbi:phospholipase [Rhodobacter sp. ETT8]|uniref:Phospholipase n=2 Tax=Pseudotabrizicola algicola TaxID=2709381 RepID=A0A6B3RN90_9RHOB|nr:phospholipase [Pseudotabrizicola algicola]NEX46663.1 phospholipase [Pseudotabrizicola algicola]